jgi:hypothetical protein
MRYGVLAGSALSLLMASDGVASDIVPSNPAAETAEIEARPREITHPNSVYFFTGRLSATSLGSTLQFNFDHPSHEMTYDNYIAGAAFSRDLYRLGLGFTFGAEIGAAERFGPYASCCNPVVRPSSWVRSEELWAGPRISHEGFVFFNTIRVAGATTWGLSFTDGSIGFERGREIAWNGSARVLFYFGPELIVSLQKFPDVEFVFRLHHRSGANGTLGNLREGYNANVFGIRYKF